MTTDTVLQISADAVQAFSKARQEPDWLTRLRLEALELAGQLHLPKLEKTKIERWDLSHIGQLPTESASGGQPVPDSIMASAGIDANNHNLIVQHNAATVQARISEELQKQGVIFTDLHTAAREHSALVEKYFMKVISAGENKLTALHAALWNGGVFIYVPKNVEVAIPLQALFVTNAKEAFSPHTLIIADTNSRVSYVSSYVSEETNQPIVHNGAVEVVAEAGAKVRYAAVHMLNEHVTDLSYRRAVTNNDASIEWLIGEMNKGNCMSEIASVLKGNGSTSDAKVVCIGEGKQDVNLTTRAVHFGKSSDSNMLTRAVMRDAAQSIINGVTKIEKGATGANGEQTERVLMLSPNARGDANPMLLIDEDEVTAGHAASAGQVDKDQLYYLMARGISRSEAEKLIILGFLEPIVSQIPIATVREQLSTLIERKLT